MNSNARSLLDLYIKAKNRNFQYNLLSVKKIGSTPFSMQSTQIDLYTEFNVPLFDKFHYVCFVLKAYKLEDRPDMSYYNCNYKVFMYTKKDLDEKRETIIEEDDVLKTNARLDRFLPTPLNIDIEDEILEGLELESQSNLFENIKLADDYIVELLEFYVTHLFIKNFPEEFNEFLYQIDQRKKFFKKTNEINFTCKGTIKNKRHIVKVEIKPDFSYKMAGDETIVIFYYIVKNVHPIRFMVRKTKRTALDCNFFNFSEMRTFAFFSKAFLIDNFENTFLAEDVDRIEFIPNKNELYIYSKENKTVTEDMIKRILFCP